MSENLKVIVDVDKTCRTCLAQKSTEELRSLLENNLNSIITEVTNIELTISSSLPKYICDECLKCLNIAVDFRKQVRQTETQLRNLILDEQSEQMTVIYKTFTVLDNGECVANIEEIIDQENDMRENLLLVEHETELQGAKHNDETKAFFKNNENIYAIREEIADNSESMNYFVTNEGDTSSNNVSNESESTNLNKSTIVLNATLTNVIKWADSESNNSIPLTNNCFSQRQELIDVEDASNSLAKVDDGVANTSKEIAKIINFSCDLCSKKFRFEFIYKKHLLKHGSPLSCDICFLLFYEINSYLLHIKSEHPKYKPFACPSCTERFFTLTSLKTHFQYHTVDRPKKFECDLCGKKFFQLNSLTIHKKSHTSLEPYKCEICDKKLSGSHSLRNHLKIHKGERKHKCETCGATFIHRFSLRAHIRTHTGEKPFTCKLCDHKFSTSSYLKIHMRTHTSEKPYACLVCPKSFVSRCALAAHEKSHTGEKKFQCDVCGWRSTRSADLQTHIRKHTGEKPYSCEQCGKSYKTASNLSAHRKTHTGRKEHICSTCSKAFGDPRTLKSHIRIHTGEAPYQCHICGHRFKQSGQLSSHRKIHRNREIMSDT